MIDRSQVELLAPAGDEECFKAAIAAGADAVFFGLEQFSARTRAKNITVNQAKYLIPLAHQHNCKAYLTLNTLITDEEMPQALSLVEKAVECGVDAIIIQDLGVLKVIREAFPNLELHASTQMTTHNLSQCKFLSELGVTQVNLSRELSLDEIQKITDFLHANKIIPEIFVQGAFCISYSGQCYLSGHLYNQAGNRGDCVQPCRRCWSSEAVDSRALFHLKDNSAFPLADKLIRQNVPVSLKIEGRIKNAEYVWAVTSAWREQIDLVLADKQILKTSPKLTGAINRDYTAGYLEGNINSQMFSNGTKDLSQIKAGTVKNYIAFSKMLFLHKDNGNLNIGDRLTIKSPSNEFICTATVTAKNKDAYSIQITNKLCKKILNGQIVYKSSSAISPQELSKIINEISPVNINSDSCSKISGKQHKVNISVNAVQDQPIKITWECSNIQVTVESEQVLAKAQNAGLTSETLRQKLTKLGGTSFTAGSFHIEKLDENLFIPLGELNNLRRTAVEILSDKLKETQKNEQTETENTRTLPQLPSEKSVYPQFPQDAYLIDSLKDLNQLLLEKSAYNRQFKILYELPSAINLVNKELFNLLNQNQDIVLYFNSILLDSDLTNTIEFLKNFDNLSKREILCENTGLAYELKNLGCRIILGANCNIYNSWNILEYSSKLNLAGIVPSLELLPSVTEKLRFPENLQIWYPKNMHKLLMQSRQCLVRNGSLCSKKQVDRQCIENCSKRLNLKGTQGEQILAVKRSGFYSALFSEQPIACNSDQLKKMVSVWIVDKRFS